MLSYAILIDGGYAKRKLGTTRAPATAEDFAEFVGKVCAHEALAEMRLHRCYYYDSTPLEEAHENPLSGAQVQFANNPVVQRSRELFNKLRTQPFMALRLGELTFNGWSLSRKKLKNAAATITVTHEDLIPVITQKGVDMRIGMDIAALTLKRHVQAIVLVSGDSDFVPAMKFARREGVALYLVPMGQKPRPSMIEHSDLMIDIKP